MINLLVTEKLFSRMSLSVNSLLAKNLNTTVDNMNDYGCIIPVAGLSRRMGDFKPLLIIENKTMIENTIDSVLKSGINKCIIILGHKGGEIEKVIQHYDKNKVKCIYNNDYHHTDMLHSIKLGMKEIISMNIKGFFILPGDMPKISSSTFIKIVNSFERLSRLIIFPTYKNKSKHPPLISVDCLESIINFNNDGGLRKALEQYKSETSYIEVEDYGCCLDADTKEEFKNLLIFGQNKKQI